MIKAIFILLFSFYFVYTQECPPQDTLNVVSMQNDWDIENKNEYVEYIGTNGNNHE